MPKFLLLLSFLILNLSVYSQIYDLIVTDKGDSLVCKIDSINDATIYFKAKAQNRWTPKYLGKEYITSYKIDAFRKKEIAIDPETSIAINPLSLKINQINRNLVYASGSYLLYHYTATLNYERVFSITADARKSQSLRLGAGVIDNNGKIIIGTLNFLRGKSKNKLESNIGFTYISEEHSYGPNFVTLHANLGYRLQNPEKRFMFRTGVGIPIGIYAGFGYSF